MKSLSARWKHQVISITALYFIFADLESWSGKQINLATKIATKNIWALFHTYVANKFARMIRQNLPVYYFKRFKSTLKFRQIFVIYGYPLLSECCSIIHSSDQYFYFSLADVENRAQPIRLNLLRSAGIFGDSGDFSPLRWGFSPLLWWIVPSYGNFSPLMEICPHFWQILWKALIIFLSGLGPKTQDPGPRTQDPGPRGWG